MNIAAGEPGRPSHLQLERCCHDKGQCQGGQHTVGSQGVDVTLAPCVCFPYPHPHCERLPPVCLLLTLLERRGVVNDVSILPPSLQPRHYNKAALSGSSLKVAEFPLYREGPEQLGTLFLEGHHTLFRTRMRWQH